MLVPRRLSRRAQIFTSRLPVMLILTLCDYIQDRQLENCELVKKTNAKKAIVKKAAPARSARRVFKQWTKDVGRNLKSHSKARTPAAKIQKDMKPTVGALRRRAGILGIGLGAH